MNTPRTDAAIVPYSALNSFSEVVPAALARQLEAELAKLAHLDWRPVAAGLPTEADGDEFGDVEWSDSKSIWQGNYANTYTERGGNHWRPIHLPASTKPVGVIVANACECRICGGPADRYASMFQCRMNPSHVADLYTGIFSDRSYAPKS